ncbi:MAG TPA: hypothetical protein VND64_19980, partial [Pirellulales bacterium]|nr:hypothetical protein [Pirellulales bacterium]
MLISVWGGVRGQKIGFHQRQRLFSELEGIGVPAEGAVAFGEVVHALKRVGVVGAERGFVMEIALDVMRQAVGRLITPVAVLLQALHRDPIELALDQPAKLLRL